MDRAAAEALGKFRKPFLTVFGEDDPVLGHLDTVLQQMVPGAEGQPQLLENVWVVLEPLLSGTLETRTAGSVENSGS